MLQLYLDFPEELRLVQLHLLHLVHLWVLVDLWAQLLRLDQ